LAMFCPAATMSSKTKIFLKGFILKILVQNQGRSNIKIWKIIFNKKSSDKIGASVMFYIFLSDQINAAINKFGQLGTG
jgi:hypothetical protein